MPRQLFLDNIQYLPHLYILLKTNHLFISIEEGIVDPSVTLDDDAFEPETEPKTGTSSLSVFEAKRGRSQSMSAFPARETSAEEIKSKLEKAQVDSYIVLTVFPETFRSGGFREACWQPKHRRKY